MAEQSRTRMQTPDFARKLASVIVLTKGPRSQLVTLQDARDLIRELDAVRQRRPVWYRAALMILVAATSGKRADIQEATRQLLAAVSFENWWRPEPMRKQSVGASERNKSPVLARAVKAARGIKVEAKRGGPADPGGVNPVAEQIVFLRQRRGWTQKQLAEKIGMKQSRISMLENPNYGNIELKTLSRIAAAFRVKLSVRFIE
jgi:DNA-binding Xre family transcriptional regulator